MFGKFFNDESKQQEDLQDQCHVHDEHKHDHHHHHHHHEHGTCNGGGCCGACGCKDHTHQQSCRLNEARFGARCRIKRLHGQGAIRQRLLDLGIVPNVEITVVRSAPLNDPIELCIGDAFVSIRRTEATHIEVEYV